jgi:formate hydrogenlyase transcriptional activator
MMEGNEQGRGGFAIRSAEDLHSGYERAPLVKVRTLNVLLVEDNAGDVRLLREALSKDPPDSFHLIHLSRMSEAVGRLAKGGIDAVLLDLGLPDAHGLESVRRAVAADPDVALVVLTGLNDDVLSAKAMEEGAQDYLIKGQTDELSIARFLRFAIERHRLQREARKWAETAVLQQVSSDVLAPDVDMSKFLPTMSASIQEVVPHDFAAIILYEPGQAVRSQFLAVPGNAIDWVNNVASLENSPAEASMRARRPVMLDKLDGAPYGREALRDLTSRGMRSGCWVPLLNQTTAMGALIVGSKREFGFTQQGETILVQIASQIASTVEKVLIRQESHRSTREQARQEYFEPEIRLEHNFKDIVGDSPELKQVLKHIETVAPTDATVLIQGETGTGKELLARSIHELSTRRERPFIKLNCAAIPAGLMESELFGHEKGAFTGAVAQKKGRVELADQGTLFLDEVGELPLDLQPKLLRALQEREIERLGGTRPISINVRLVAATNRDLAQMVATREFRSDLYYRLKVFPILAPALRDRQNDIPMLVRHFVTKYSQRMGKVITDIRPEAMAALVRWAWPGNIRELENFIERAVILSRGSTLHILLAELQSTERPVSQVATMQDAEREHVIRTLRRTKGLIGGPNGAAEQLALNRTTLNSKLKKLGIKRCDYT